MSPNNHYGAVFWLTGLSGSGKTTIGTELTYQLKKLDIPVVFLDGDALREITGQVFGHTREERLKASLVYGRLCRYLAAQSINVVCATISLFHETQDWNREHIENYIEVLVYATIDTVSKRDPKKIYAKDIVNAAPIVGIDIPAEFPKNPDLVINNSSTTIDISLIVNKLIKQFHQRILLHSNLKEIGYAK